MNKNKPKPSPRYLLSERDKKDLRMIETGKLFANLLLPEGFRVLGVDPGYLFAHNTRASINLPEDVVDTMLMRLKEARR